MKNHGFKKVGDWFLNSKGKLDIDFPGSLESTIGVIAMAIDDEVVFLSSTIHYGPRIRDFKHSQSGDTGNSKIHHRIEESMKKGGIITVWAKDTQAPLDEKRKLLKLLNPIWNQRS